MLTLEQRFTNFVLRRVRANGNLQSNSLGIYITDINTTFVMEQDHIAGALRRDAKIVFVFLYAGV